MCGGKIIYFRDLYYVIGISMIIYHKGDDIEFCFYCSFFFKIGESQPNHAMHDAVVAYFQSRGSIIREAKTGAGRRRGREGAIDIKEIPLKLFEVVLQMINL